MLADGHQVTNSSVARALQRRGLLLPHGFRADGQSWAVRRRKVFRDYPPNATESGRPTSPEFETTNGGIWRICAVIDYVTKYNPAITVTLTSRSIDALHCRQPAVTEAQRLLGLDDLRADRDVMDILDANATVIGQAQPRSRWSPTTAPAFAGKPFQPPSTWKSSATEPPNRLTSTNTTCQLLDSRQDGADRIGVIHGA